MVEKHSLRKQRKCRKRTTGGQSTGHEVEGVRKPAAVCSDADRHILMILPLSFGSFWERNFLCGFGNALGIGQMATASGARLWKALPVPQCRGGREAERL